MLKTLRDIRLIGTEDDAAARLGPLAAATAIPAGSHEAAAAPALFGALPLFGVPFRGTSTASAAATSVGANASASASVKPATTANAAAGYTAATNQQWNLKALFGPDPNAVLARFNGQGVHIADYDNGIDLTNASLKASYDASRQLVIGGMMSDPTKGSGEHGTATAGIMVADASQNGGTDTGIAYGAKLTAVDIFSGVASTNMIAAVRDMAGFDVTNNSWGWTDGWVDGTSVSGSFGQLFSAALTSDAASGRAGLGTVVVKAAGNDWGTHRDANESEFSADRHVVLVGAVWQGGDVASYSDRGADLLVSSYGNILTTDKTGAAGYTAGSSNANFDGTSAATPEVTATVADMMSADATLGWRDVQAILALTATDTETKAFTTAATGRMAFGWTVNGAATENGGGLHFSNDVGFGTENAAAAIREAEVWRDFAPAPQTSANELHASASVTPGQALTARAADQFTLHIGAPLTVEAADLTLTMSDTALNHVKVEMVSPDGTHSILLSPSDAAQSANNFTWTLGSEAFRGELSTGDWTVKVSDTTASDTGSIAKATLDLYGAATSLPHVFHYTDEATAMDAASPARIMLNDRGAVGDWIDTATTTSNETVNLNTGASSILAGTKFLTIGAGTTVNNLTLGAGADTAIANNNGDELVGGHGADTMMGGDGADTFVAGFGGGQMTGGGGKDTFAFNHSGFGTYAITDFFAGQDKLDLRGLGDDPTKLAFASTAAGLTISNVDPAGDKIVLAGVHAPHLAASDILYA